MFIPSQDLATPVAILYQYNARGLHFPRSRHPCGDLVL